jgi:glycyl-tRNA synthetase beta chain
MGASLIIELGTEDLPARYVRPLSLELARGITSGLRRRNVSCDYLNEHQVDLPFQVFKMAYEASELGAQDSNGDLKWFGGLRIFATPRRIALLLNNVREHQPEQRVERIGPALSTALKDGQPTPAALGFAKSCGVEFSSLGQKDGKLHFAKTAPGKATAELLPEIFEETLKQMDELVPKRMRWGAGTETFVRPVQWLVALLGEQVIPLQRFGLIAGNTTYGHRFHAPAAISLQLPADYEASLKAAKVWADTASRKSEIKRQIEVEAAKLGGTARITEDLLDEVTALVEWPVVISGRMEDRFMQLPPEVIIATVETNQRYFTVFDADQKLLPVFITISNVESKDVSQVISGNERVVRPRLSDALFFWEQDSKLKISSLTAKLKTITYQKELGSLFDKTDRIQELTDLIAAQLGKSDLDRNHYLRGAQLCKNDLVTRMVYEFPELQGVMGGYYADKSGESAAVATAIREHYLPTQQGTPIPSTREGQIVALADKLDTIAGIFAIGQKPTASKDPYALRRAALGALRIAIEGKLPLDMAALLKSALEAQPAGKRDAATLAELTEFVLERLRAYYADQGLPVEMYEAVKSLGITSPLDFDARVQALRGFWALPEAKNLAAAHKRVRNILKQATEIPSSKNWHALILHGTSEDKRLIEAIDRVTNGHAEILHGAFVGTDTARVYHQAIDWLKKSPEERYSAALLLLATLRDAVFNFFEQESKVMDPREDLRAGRVTLLRHLDDLCKSVADISCLPG